MRARRLSARARGDFAGEEGEDGKRRCKIGGEEDFGRIEARETVVVAERGGTRSLEEVRNGAGPILGQ